MISTVLTYIITFLVVILVLKLISLPFKIMIKLAINMLVGGVILYLLTKIGIAIAITWWMAAMVAVLGIPGVLIILALNFII